jgi:hypothetical protein
MAQSGGLVVYVNNKPFTGSVNVSKDVVMVSIQELSQMLDFDFSYNELTNCLKINDTVYAGLKSYNNGRLYVSLGDVAVCSEQDTVLIREPAMHPFKLQCKKVPVATAAPVSAIRLLLRLRR